jgi:polysaccharide pyruvyl transferase WcaK-like protein
MFEQDYIMRMIKEMVRLFLKLLFNINTDSPTAELLENEQKQRILNNLTNMIDEGNINKAENELYSIIENGEKDDLEMVILFYSYLNDKDDDFLSEHDFSREEVKDGLKTVLSKYGFESFSELFF